MAPRVAKLNKVEFEAQPVTPERTAARLRRQTAGLKQARRQDAIAAPVATADPPGRAAQPKTNRTTRPDTPASADKGGDLLVQDRTL